MTEVNLPFKVGDNVEVKSFELGYRGAWFLCKITKIVHKWRERALFYMLEYLDFPGEGIHTTQVFQKPEGGSENYLMVRPVYPRHCHEIEVLNKEGGLEEALVVHDSWKVGDLVDWWTDHCYWCGTVLEVRENESLQIELLPPPYGEGSIYDAQSKDLRPSLEWSLEDGWSVPFSKDGEKRQCAKLMKLLTEDQVSGSESREEVKQGLAQFREEEKQRPTQSREEEKQRPTEKLECDGDLRLNIMESGSTEEEKQSPTQLRKEEKQRPTQKMEGDKDLRLNIMESESTEEEKQSPTQLRKEEKQRPTQKMEGDKDLRLNIMESESIEAAVMDLEELIVRFEWLKGMLRPSSSENSSWKYEDYRPSSSRI